MVKYPQIYNQSANPLSLPVSIRGYLLCNKENNRSFTTAVCFRLLLDTRQKGSKHDILLNTRQGEESVYRVLVQKEIYIGQYSQFGDGDGDIPTVVTSGRHVTCAVNTV